MILSVDPGLRKCGCAIWRDDGHFFAARLVHNLELARRGPFAWRVMAAEILEWVFKQSHDRVVLVIETPRIYTDKQRSEENDPNDLLELAGVVGALSSSFPVEGFYYPQDWKGQVPKKIMTNRIRDTLTEAELSRVERLPRGGLDHNVLDGVGVGLKFFGRL